MISVYLLLDCRRGKVGMPRAVCALLLLFSPLHFSPFLPIPPPAQKKIPSAAQQKTKSLNLQKIRQPSSGPKTLNHENRR